MRALVVIAAVTTLLGCEQHEVSRTVATSSAIGASSVLPPLPALSALPLEQIIFKVTRFTRNLKTCEKEGASVIEQLKGEELFVVHTGDGLSMLTSCTTPAQCDQKHENFRGGGEPGTRLKQVFTKRDKDGGLSGPIAGTGWPRKVGCRQAVSVHATLARNGDTVTIEVRGAHADVPRNDKGRCTQANTKKRLEGKPCNWYEVIEAKALEKL